MSRTCSIHGEMRNLYKILVGKSQGKRLRYKCEDGIKINFREIVCGLCSSGSGQSSVVNMIMNVQLQ
jgi:hypothetical protein